MTVTNETKKNAQELYCDKNAVPMFVPYDGKCFHCHRNIWDGVSIETASEELITACPFCYTSFVE